MNWAALPGLVAPALRILDRLIGLLASGKTTFTAEDLIDVRDRNRIDKAAAFQAARDRLAKS